MNDQREIPIPGGYREMLRVAYPLMLSMGTFTIMQFCDRVFLARYSDIAIQAALSGHRLIATMHAGEPATAVARLLEMGMEPYQVTSSLYGVLTLRLIRRRRGSGYKGRVPLAEFGRLDQAAVTAALARADAGELRDIFHRQAGHATLREVAEFLVAQGVTDAAEIRRVLGD